MDVVLRALADPNRRRILSLVGGRELPAGVIAAHFKLSRPAVSQHLRVLRDAGLLSERREATRRLYRTRDDELARVMAELDAFWGDALERLKHTAEGEER
jgi:DNA-binding transcriptional ArsR family regulator